MLVPSSLTKPIPMITIECARAFFCGFIIFFTLHCNGHCFVYVLLSCLFAQQDHRLVTYCIYAYYCYLRASSIQMIHNWIRQILRFHYLRNDFIGAHRTPLENWLWQIVENKVHAHNLGLRVWEHQMSLLKIGHHLPFSQYDTFVLQWSRKGPKYETAFDFWMLSELNSTMASNEPKASKIMINQIKSILMAVIINNSTNSKFGCDAISIESNISRRLLYACGNVPRLTFRTIQIYTIYRENWNRFRLCDGRVYFGNHTSLSTNAHISGYMRCVEPIEHIDILSDCFFTCMFGLSSFFLRCRKMK